MVKVSRYRVSLRLQLQDSELLETLLGVVWLLVQLDICFDLDIIVFPDGTELSVSGRLERIELHLSYLGPRVGATAVVIAGRERIMKNVMLAFR